MLSVRPIIAGDPSRGALSLDTEANIRKGQRVQFLHAPENQRAFRLSPSESITASQRDQDTTSDQPGMIFANHSDPNALEKVDPAASSSNNFVAASEHGFIVGRPREASWICQVDGAQGDVRV